MTAHPPFTNAPLTLITIHTQICTHKQNCGTTASQRFYVKDEALGETTIASGSRTAISGNCYFTGTRLDVVQPLDKTWMEITVAFTPAMAVAAGENVTINMAGFTNHNFTGIDKVNDFTGVGKGGFNWHVPLKVSKLRFTKLNERPPNLTSIVVAAGCVVGKVYRLLEGGYVRAAPCGLHQLLSSAPSANWLQPRPGDPVHCDPGQGR